MRKTILKLAVVIALLVITAFIVVVINQTAQLVALATTFAPWLGAVTLWSLIALYTFCVITPVYLFMRMPRALTPPASEEDAEFPKHLERVTARLRRNPHLAMHSLESRTDIDASLAVLDGIATQRTKDVASQVFITTAISQNGNLDAFLVLAAQSKLVLDVARTYYQRPTLRDLIFLYSNVAATAYVAGELEDLDLAEQVEPVIGALLGSSAGAVPGLGAITTVFTNSILTGTANAFLTLRVGVITQQYCRAVVVPSRKSIRRMAVAQATAMLGGIALAGSRRVMGAVLRAGRGKAGATMESLTEQLRASTNELREATASAANAAAAGVNRAGSATLDRLGLRRPMTPPPLPRPEQGPRPDDPEANR